MLRSAFQSNKNRVMDTFEVQRDATLPSPCRTAQPVISQHSESPQEFLQTQEIWPEQRQATISITKWTLSETRPFPKFQGVTMALDLWKRHCRLVTNSPSHDCFVQVSALSRCDGINPWTHTHCSRLITVVLFPSKVPVFLVIHMTQFWQMRRERIFWKGEILRKFSQLSERDSEKDSPLFCFYQDAC